MKYQSDASRCKINSFCLLYLREKVVAGEHSSIAKLIFTL